MYPAKVEISCSHSGDSRVPSSLYSMSTYEYHRLNYALQYLCAEILIPRTSYTDLDQCMNMDFIQFDLYPLRSLKDSRWRYRLKTAICKPHKETTEETNLTDPPSFQNSEKIHFCCLNSQPWDIIIILQANKYDLRILFTSCSQLTERRMNSQQG